MSRLASPRIAVPSTVAAAAAAATFGIIRVADTPSSETTVAGIEHLGLAMFAAAWLLLIPGILCLGRRAGARRATVIAAAGQVALAAIATTSNVLGEDPAFFPAVAGPANLAIAGGWIALAVVLRRRRAVPAWLSFALPVAYVSMLPLSAVGGGVVAAGYWLAAASVIHADPSRGGARLGVPAGVRA